MNSARYKLSRPAQPRICSRASLGSAWRLRCLWVRCNIFMVCPPRA